MRRYITFFIAALVATLGTFPARAATPGFRIPSGYFGGGWDKLGSGLDHVTIKRAGPGQAQSIHVARMKPDAAFALRAVVSDQKLSGGLERTSSMCKRTKCAAAVNGDFFVTSGAPVGGLAIRGQALRSPTGNRPQLLLGGAKKVSVGAESWVGQIILSDRRDVTLDGVNIPLRGGKISLFTAAYGKTTGNRKGVAELAVQIVQPKGPLVLGRPATIRFLDIRHIGNAPIPAGGAILAGDGAGGQALDSIWWMVQNKHLSPQATIEIRSTNPASESIGGAPVLLKDGRRAFTIVPRGLVQGRHPRTIVGWNPKGEVFLVTIDGRQTGYSEGMTLVEAADFMRQMGATDAINLDGGGSTTFVTKGGRVRNSPSDVVVVRNKRRTAAAAVAPGDRFVGRPERSVATALVIVPIAVKAVRPQTRTLRSAVSATYGTRFMPLADDPAAGPFVASVPIDDSMPPRTRLAWIALTLMLSVAIPLYPATRVSRRSRRATRT